jgi:putative colanic acid biosynthesis acetyltransferase WcaF
MTRTSAEQAGLLTKSDPFEGASFSLDNRLRRGCWQLACGLLFSPSPIALHSWRCWLLRRFGARIAAGCAIYPDVRIWAPWNLEMAPQACMGPGVHCYNLAPTRLGRRVVVSQRSHLCTGSHDYESETFQLIMAPIVIGDDVWLCAECFIAPGVCVGEGAVVAARAVVTRTLPPWTVCGGNPCRPIKPRRRPAYAKPEESS